MQRRLFLSCLLLGGCAQALMNAAADRIKVQKTLHSYTDPDLTASGVTGKKLLVVPLLGRDLQVPHTRGIEDYRQFKPFGEQYDKNIRLLQDTTAWKQAFDSAYAAYFSAAKLWVSLVPFDSLNINEGSLDTADFEYGYQGKGEDALKFWVPRTSFLEKIGQQPDYVLYLSQMRVNSEAVHPQVSSCGATCYSETLTDTKDVELAVGFQYTLWDVKKGRVAACGSFEEYEKLSDDYPVTKILARKSTDEILGLIPRLERPEEDSRNMTRGF